MYVQKDLDLIFQRAEAPDELDCARTGRCMCSRPGCGDCFPGLAPEFGPPITNAEAWLMIPAETNGAEVVLQRSLPLCIAEPVPGRSYGPALFECASSTRQCKPVHRFIDPVDISCALCLALHRSIIFVSWEALADSVLSAGVSHIPIGSQRSTGL